MMLGTIKVGYDPIPDVALEEDPLPPFVIEIDREDPPTKRNLATEKKLTTFIFIMNCCAVAIVIFYGFSWLFRNLKRFF